MYDLSITRNAQSATKCLQLAGCITIFLRAVQNSSLRVQLPVEDSSFQTLREKFSSSSSKTVVFRTVQDCSLQAVKDCSLKSCRAVKDCSLKSCQRLLSYEPSKTALLRAVKDCSLKSCQILLS
jgi:hypothetical protein